MRFRFAGLAIDSAIPLDGLPADDGDARPPEMRIDEVGSPSDLPVPEGLDDVVVWSDGSRLEILRTADGRLLRWPGFADMLVRDGGRSIVVCPAAGTTPDVLSHLLLNQAMSFALAEHRTETLHGSAVAVPGRGALAFVGASGVGKSTMAAALASSGCSLLADDLIALRKADGSVRVEATGERLRLWPGVADALVDCAVTRGEGSGGKVEVRASEGSAPTSAPLRGVYVLHAADGPPRISVPLDTRDALLALLSGSYNRLLRDRARQALQFDILTTTVSSAFVRTVSWDPGPGQALALASRVMDG